MKGSRLQKTCFAIATGVIAAHVVVAATAKPSFALTMCGDAAPCALVILAIVAMRENLRAARGILPLFWRVFVGGLVVMLLSQLFWFYFDWRRQNGVPSPVPGDVLFLIAHVFFLCAIALRPHSSSARRDLRIRALDFVLLSLWWLCLYGYFALPWQIFVRDLRFYNPDYYILAFLQHLVLVAVFATLALRKRAAWRAFYLQLMATFVLIAAGNLTISLAIDRGTYYAGSFYDTPIFVGMYLFTVTACFGWSLEPREDATPNREVLQGLWTARIAMLVVLSIPVIALWGLWEAAIPLEVAVFRLRLIFVSMFILGSLVYWKLDLQSRELVHSVRLTRDSIEKLKAVQTQVSQSEKFVALGRLAAGTAHEISNPLTAILGYSELLADIPSLSPDDRSQAQSIREQVHRAQAAVASLRSRMRQTPPLSSFLVDKKPES